MSGQNIRTNRGRQFGRFFLGLVFAFLPRAVHAGIEAIPIVVTDLGSGTNSRYCGLYCLYQVAQLSGIEICKDELFRPEYLTGAFGSSIGDLQRCCDRFDLAMCVNSHASYAELWLWAEPTLILVKSAPNARTAHHWVLIVTTDATGAELFDPSVGTVNVSPAELLSLWNGVAVAVCPKRSSLRLIYWDFFCFLCLFFWLTLGFVCIKIVSRYCTARPFLGLLTTATLFSLCLHLLTPLGFARNSITIEEISNCYATPVVDEVHADDVTTLISHGAVLVDVRDRRQFVYAHIPGATNIEIGSSYFNIKAALYVFSDDRHMILYCNSPSCDWSEEMAKSSLFRRFKRVSVFRGGMAAWHQQSETRGKG